jgi:hypothetical protein
MGASLTFVAIIIITLAFIFKGSIVELVKKIRLGKSAYQGASKNRRVKDLWSHDLFMTVDAVKKKVEPIRFTTHGEYDSAKSKLLKMLINNQLDNFKKRMKEFILKDCIDNFDGQKLKFIITDTLRSGTIEYNEKTLNEFTEMGVRAEDGRFLIDEYGFFRDEVQEGFFERIDSITTNANYYNNYDRLSAVFEVLAMGLYLIPKDSKAACNNMNGRFKKYAGAI